MIQEEGGRVGGCPEGPMGRNAELFRAIVIYRRNPLYSQEPVCYIITFACPASGLELSACGGVSTWFFSRESLEASKSEPQTFSDPPSSAFF
jgi:hypothetical protein